MGELRLPYHLAADPFDPHDNILAGTAYLGELYNRLGAAGFVAAYNAGPKLYQDYVSGLRPLRDGTVYVGDPRMTDQERSTALAMKEQRIARANS